MVLNPKILLCFIFWFGILIGLKAQTDNSNKIDFLEKVQKYELIYSPPKVFSPVRPEPLCFQFGDCLILTNVYFKETETKGVLLGFYLYGIETKNVKGYSDPNMQLLNTVSLIDNFQYDVKIAPEIIKFYSLNQAESRFNAQGAENTILN